MISLILLLFLLVALLPKAHAQAPSGNYLELNGGHIKAALPADNLPAGFTFEAWVKPDITASFLKNGMISVGFECLDGNFIVYNEKGVLKAFYDRTLPNGDMRMVIGSFSNLKYPDGFPLMFVNVTIYRP